MSIDIRCYFLLETLQLSTALGSERMTYKSRKVDADVGFYVHARVYVPVRTHADGLSAGTECCFLVTSFPPMLALTPCRRGR